MSEHERRAGVVQMATGDGGRVSLVEQFMPRFDTRSQNAIEIRAPAQAVFTAGVDVTLVDSRDGSQRALIEATVPG